MEHATEICATAPVEELPPGLAEELKQAAEILHACQAADDARLPPEEYPPAAAPIAFDPFASAEEEAAFDAPTPAELEDMAAEFELATAAEETMLPLAAPPLEPIKVAATYVAVSSSNPAFLESARQAARARSIENERPTFGKRVWKERQLLAGLAIGIAVPAIFLAGAMALGDRGNVDTTIAAPEARAAETQAVVSAGPLYATAQQLLAAGQHAQAEPLLRHAAEAGHVLAQYRLAKLYERGEASAPNLSLARRWTERAALGGNCRAMHDLGVFMARGEGAPVDEAGALRWFREAAELGVADSQFNLGILYAQGRGAPTNTEEALFWFLVASRRNVADAVDNAVNIASRLEPALVARVTQRARAFSVRAADPAVNDDRCTQNL